MGKITYEDEDLDDEEDFPEKDEDLAAIKKKIAIAKATAELAHYALLEKLKNYLFYYYAPVQDPKEAEFHFTTAEVHSHMLNIYPNKFELSAELVATWLNSGGFTFCDMGEMRFEWIMKKA